ncbi:MAG TPA: AAA family ATPase, partial [Longimicrobiales bacterium]|nr:AAA family ATPase [Longimicrobiales bacterium]
MRGGFIGRDRELGELAAGLEGAFSGRGAIFLLAGEPGIGKTALAERFANHATERGARVVWSRSWEGGDAAPYWLWAQIIRAVIEAADEDTLASLLSPGLGHIALLVPELADRFGNDAKPTRAIDSEAGRFYLFESTARFLKQASSTTPLVLLLDDVLAGDRPSLQLLRFLARDVRASRILVVATHRDSGPPQSGEAVELLADLVREGHVLNLRGLDRTEVGRLIAEVSGVAPWKGTVSAIHEATAGNPLFVREVTRLLAASEALDRPRRSSIPVPDSVRAVIRRRLTPLSADAIQVLSAAAVVGRDFDLAWVDAACNLPSDRILAAIAHGTSLGVIAQAPEGERIYRFTHPLMREAIYEGLPIAARAQIHQVVAAAIERLHGTDSTSHLGELAYHFAKASSIEQSGKAQEYASRAGDRAMKAFAYEEAVVQYRRALDALRLSGRPDAALRC